MRELIEHHHEALALLRGACKIVESCKPIAQATEEWIGAQQGGDLCLECLEIERGGDARCLEQDVRLFLDSFANQSGFTDASTAIHDRERSTGRRYLFAQQGK